MAPCSPEEGAVIEFQVSNCFVTPGLARMVEPTSLSAPNKLKFSPRNQLEIAHY